MKQRILLGLGFVAAALYRLVPFRPPNVEPLLSIMMPFSKKISALEMALFGFLSIVVYDFLTAGLGGHTWSAAACYAVLGLASSLYFAKQPFSKGSYVTFSIASIIFYDVMTGIIFGPLFAGGSVAVAIVGQIPFTMLHLMGGVIFALTVSPIIEWALTKNFSYSLKNFPAENTLQKIKGE